MLLGFQGVYSLRRLKRVVAELRLLFESPLPWAFTLSIFAYFSPFQACAFSSLCHFRPFAFSDPCLFKSLPFQTFAFSGRCHHGIISLSFSLFRAPVVDKPFTLPPIRFFKLSFLGFYLCRPLPFRPSLLCITSKNGFTKSYHASGQKSESPPLFLRCNYQIYICACHRSCARRSSRLRREVTTNVVINSNPNSSTI